MIWPSSSPMPTTNGVTQKASQYSADRRTNKKRTNDWIFLIVTATYHDAAGLRGKFKLKQTKASKFDEIINMFPNDDLVAPVDGETIRKVFRRVRQKRQKRRKTMEPSATDAQEDSKPLAKKLKVGSPVAPKVAEGGKSEPNEAGLKPKASVKHKPDVEPKVAAKPKSDAKPKPRPAVKPAAAVPETLTIRVPGKGTVFPQFDMGSIEEFG